MRQSLMRQLCRHIFDEDQTGIYRIPRKQMQ